MNRDWVLWNQTVRWGVAWWSFAGVWSWEIDLCRSKPGSTGWSKKLNSSAVTNEASADHHKHPEAEWSFRVAHIEAREPEPLFPQINQSLAVGCPLGRAVTLGRAIPCSWRPSPVRDVAGAIPNSLKRMHGSWRGDLGRALQDPLQRPKMLRAPPSLSWSLSAHPVFLALLTLQCVPSIWYFPPHLNSDFRDMS